MHSSARHLLLIIGSVLTIFGILLFFFMEGNQSLKITGGFLFGAGAIMITRGLRNPQKNKNRKPDIRGKYKSNKESNSNSSENEIH